MSDPRPSENQDDYPKFPLMSAMFGAPKPTDTATVIPSEAASLAEIAKQLRIANLIAYRESASFGSPTRNHLADVIEEGLGLS